MSSNTNNLNDILTKLENEVAQDVTNRILHHRSGRSPKSSHAEAIAAVLALLPEEEPIPTDLKEKSLPDFMYKLGKHDAIDQTRRNLIGEQPGDSNSPLGESKPLGNQVMPEAPASGKEER